MREILFRAKRKDNGEWVEGYYAFIDGVHYIYTGALCNGGLYVVAKRFEVDPSTLCQYTGLTDKTRKKIWENDIVRYRSYIGIVIFGQYSGKNYGFYIQWIKGDEALREDFIYWASKIKRVGNVFDNPELLEMEAG